MVAHGRARGGMARVGGARIVGLTGIFLGSASQQIESVGGRMVGGMDSMCPEGLAGDGNFEGRLTLINTPLKLGAS